MKMVNSDKKVLETFNELLDKTKGDKNVLISRQNFEYLFNVLNKHFILEASLEKAKETSEDRKLKINRQVKEINRLHEDLKYWKSNSMDKRHKIGELMQENQNLKKGIGKSSLDILNGNSDALYNVKHTTDILDAFNNIILGLFKLSDEQWVFNTINVNTDTIDQYKKVEKEVGLELHELAGKIEIMRNLIFAEVIDWHKMSDTFRVLGDKNEFRGI